MLLINGRVLGRDSAHKQDRPASPKLKDRLRTQPEL
jgi:hypothetical protein